jgi:hypothetical protein
MRELRLRPEPRGVSFRLPAILLAATLALLLTQGASAGGGNYAISGGTPAEQATVRDALNASSFTWSVLPQTIQVTIQPSPDDHATPGNVYFDPQLLDMGTFSWAIVQHEFAHQIDFLLLDDSERARLALAIGGAQWFPSGAPLTHASYSCERFASLVAWAYWPSAENSLRPRSTADEAGGMPAPDFRALLSQMLNVSASAPASPPPPQKTFVPELPLMQSSAA